MRSGSFAAFVSLVLALLPLFPAAPTARGADLPVVERQIVLLGEEIGRRLAEVAPPALAAEERAEEKRRQESLVRSLRQRIARLHADVADLDPAAGANLRPRLHRLAMQVENLQRVQASRSDTVQGDPPGSISGSVTAEGSGDPLMGFVNVFDVTGAFVTFTSISSPGTYTVTNLTTGDYFLTTSNFGGFVDELYNGHDCIGGDSCDPLTGNSVSVEAGTVTPGIDFVLRPGGRIVGSVTATASGDPVDDMLVELSQIQGGITRRVAFGITDANGQYSIGSLPSGSFFVRTLNEAGLIDEAYDDLPCVPCDPGTGTPIVVTAPDETPDIDFALATGGRISGSVTAEATGNPIANAVIEIYNAQGLTAVTAFANTGGDFVTLPGLPSGSYLARSFTGVALIDEVYDDRPCEFCDPTIGTLIPVTAPAETSGIDFALEVPGSLSGTLTDAVTGDPVTNGFLSIYDVQGTFHGAGSTASNGTYTAAHLPSGEFLVIASSFFVIELYDDVPCPSAVCDLSAGTPVAVFSGLNTPNIDFALENGGHIAGRVTDALTGVPLGGVLVTLYDQQGDLVFVGLTDITGNYFAGDLPAGFYFAVTTNVQGYGDKLYNNLPCPQGVCNPLSGTAIAVNAGIVTDDIDFSLRPSTLIFYDGFAAGNTSRWSSVVD